MSLLAADGLIDAFLGLRRSDLQLLVLLLDPLLQLLKFVQKFPLHEGHHAIFAFPYSIHSGYDLRPGRDENARAAIWEFSVLKPQRLWFEGAPLWARHQGFGVGPSCALTGAAPWQAENARAGNLGIPCAQTIAAMV